MSWGLLLVACTAAYVLTDALMQLWLPPDPDTNPTPEKNNDDDA